MDPIIKKLYTQEELEGKIVEYNEKYEKYKGKNDKFLVITLSLVQYWCFSF